MPTIAVEFPNVYIICFQQANQVGLITTVDTDRNVATSNPIPYLIGSHYALLCGNGCIISKDSNMEYNND